MLGPESRFRRREGLLAQRAADARILLNPEDGQYYALDEIGGRVWDLCDGTRSVAAMVEEICREYEAAPEEVQADVLELLAELSDGKLVVQEA
jgi:pyrroloquinoline quinone biosynthesis protein D